MATSGVHEGRQFEVVVVDKRSSSTEGDAHYDTFPEVDHNIEMEDEPIVPDHYYEGGKIPVFKPTMEQFKSFKEFIRKIDHYGMQSGIVKVIPPAEWRETLPKLETKVKEIRVKNPIVQHIAGTGGVYRQSNVEKQKSYNLPQWRAVCESSDHQPPARRGERRKNQEVKATRTTKPKQTRNTRRSKAKEDNETVDAPLTPPATEKEDLSTTKAEEDATCSPAPIEGGGRQPRGRQPATRKKYIRKTKEEVDEVMENDPAWEGFDYNLESINDFTTERCEELEKAYWRTLTYNNPLYGADMPGSLFDDNTTTWNVAKLENILDCLGKKLPGVNTAYLYLGMWKSTFAWHLEDVDLYSINYIHFGAPKQWYSISQEDAPRFANAMKSIWPNEAKKCDQFLRHKTFLVSPSMLSSQYNIKVNKLVHHEGEFVITFPFGYHSGYNLGYNCAESVNFATEAWLDYGRNAKKCECTEDSVWVDVNEVERKMRGEDTEEEFSEDESEEEDDLPHDLPTPPESVEGDVKRSPKKKMTPRKRKVQEDDLGLGSVKKIRLKFSNPTPDPCILCPNNLPSEELARTDNGKNAHRLCAVYTPETYFGIDLNTDEEIIYNVDGIPKARMDLKCFFCRSAKGSCFQCSEKKCIRAYHATCAAAAGVLVDMRNVAAVDENGATIEKTELDFRCRFHRPKRGKELDGEKLENVKMISDFARGLVKGDLIQMQYYRGDIFAGVVVENRASEAMVLIDLMPSGGQMEVEWKWILAHDPNLSNFPSDTGSFAGPHTLGQKRPTKKQQNKNVPTPNMSSIPRAGDIFHPSAPNFIWNEFNIGRPAPNPHQEKPSKWWYYLGEMSTENIQKYTEDPRKRVPNDAAIMPTAKKSRISGPTPITPSFSRPSANQPPVLKWPQQQQITSQQTNGNHPYWNQYPPYAYGQPYNPTGAPRAPTTSSTAPAPVHTQSWQNPQFQTASYEAQRMAYYQNYAESLLSMKQRALLHEQRQQSGAAGKNALQALSAAPTAPPPVRMLTPPLPNVAAPSVSAPVLATTAVATPAV